MVDGTYIEGAVDMLGEGVDTAKTAVGITDDDVSGVADQGLSTFQELRDSVLAPLRTQPGLPQDSTSANTPDTDDPLSQARKIRFRRAGSR